MDHIYNAAFGDAIANAMNLGFSGTEFAYKGSPGKGLERSVYDTHVSRPVDGLSIDMGAVYGREMGFKTKLSYDKSRSEGRYSLGA
jgi:hypothetical protein|tara:strand:+ start:400 stop:657 length:258 start_codon:yes stop_codon:yes gene_type:complete